MFEFGFGSLEIQQMQLLYCLHCKIMTIEAVEKCFAKFTFGRNFKNTKIEFTMEVKHIYKILFNKSQD